MGQLQTKQPIHQTTLQLQTKQPIHQTTLQLQTTPRPPTKLRQPQPKPPRPRPRWESSTTMQKKNQQVVTMVQQKILTQMPKRSQQRLLAVEIFTLSQRLPSAPQLQCSCRN